MEVSARDIIDSVDLNRQEALLPIYESVVNSIISLGKTDREDKRIDVFIDRQMSGDFPTSLFDRNPAPISKVTIVDNGEGFNEMNFASFKKPFSKINKQYGCKGVGRFTILALFRRMDVVSVYREGVLYKRRSFSFDAEREIYDVKEEVLTGDYERQTKVILSECHNERLLPYTAKNADDIAKGIMGHCFIYYLSGTLPEINIIERNCREKKPSLSVESYFRLESKDKEKTISVRGEEFKLYIIKSSQTTTRKYNYVSLCANSRTVGGKRELSKVDSLYAYPISENGISKFIDVYVVSSYLDSHVNNQRTGFTIPENNEVGLFPFADDPVSVEDIMRGISVAVADLYADFAKETQKRNIAEVRKYIEEKAPQYRSILYMTMIR